MKIEIDELNCILCSFVDVVIELYLIIENYK